MSAADLHALLQDLGSLASGLCQDTGILLQPGTGWSWNPAQRVLRVDQEELLSQPLEASAGIVAHEAGHHLISRYIDFLVSYTGGPLTQLTLNAIEDARVEAFLPTRYPGVGAWLRRARQGLQTEGLPRVDQFLLAIASSSILPPETLPLAPEVHAALQLTAQARERAIAGYLPTPTLIPPPGTREDPQLQALLVPAARGLRTPRESYLLALTRGVLEAFPPILEAARALMEQDQHAGAPPDWAQLGRSLQRVQRDAPVRLASAPPPPLAPRPERRAPREEPYGEAWKRVASQAEELGATLERVLLPRQRLGWRNGFATGQRVDLRSALRAEADPRYLTRVWSRKTVPSRRRSAWSLLVDLSGSMRRDGRIHATLSAVALFAETLALLGIPFRIDGFQDELIPFMDFDHPLDLESRRRLGGMPLEVQGRRPGGHNTPAFNDDGPCVLAAAGHLLARPEQDRVLMVLCDGHPEGRRSGMKDLEKAIQGLQPRLTLVGLGLGPDTSHVAKIYPVARANLTVERLTAEVGALLQDQLLALR